MQQKQIRTGLAAMGAVLVLALIAFGALGFSGGASAVTSQYVKPGTVAKKVVKPKARAKVAVTAKAKTAAKTVVVKKSAQKKRR